MSGSQYKNVAVVILAAGQGKRMKSDIPKVMHKLNGTPIIGREVSEVENLGIKPVIVVNGDGGMIREYLGDRVEYAVQSEPLGTGHATASAGSVLKERAKHVVVLYGDHPYVADESIRRLINRHLEGDDTITMMTAVVPDFADWRAPFRSFGRVVRGADGNIMKIVERKDSTEAEKEIQEINPGYYCFKAGWLWENLRNLKNDNAQGEYYLTDLVKQAIESRQKISSIDIKPEEALGVNSREDLQAAEKIYV